MSFYVVEPNIKVHGKYKLNDFEDAFNESDIVVFLVAHNEFKKLKAFQNKIIIDFCGVLNKLIYGYNFRDRLLI